VNTFLFCWDLSIHSLDIFIHSLDLLQSWTSPCKVGTSFIYCVPFYALVCIFKTCKKPPYFQKGPLYLEVGWFYYKTLYDFCKKLYWFKMFCTNFISAKAFLLKWYSFMLIAPAPRSCVHPSCCHLCTSVAAGLGQADRPNASHVDHRPTMSYLWDLSIALRVPWEYTRWSVHAGVSTLECPH